MKEKQYSIEAAIVKGRELPKWYLEEPALYPGDDFYLTAFYRLSTCRLHQGDIPGNIPWSEIVKYSDRRKLDEDNSLLFEHVLAEMDCAYVQRYIRKQKSLKPKGKQHARIPN